MHNMQHNNYKVADATILSDADCLWSLNFRLTSGRGGEGLRGGKLFLR